MPKLFAIYIGGSVEGSNIELHDMRFAVGEMIEDTYTALRSSWWGTPKSLHLDCWMDLAQVDGYDVTISDQPSTAPEKLWFINIGGYDATQFTELHRFLFLVGTDEKTVLRRALDQARDFAQRHRDDLYDVDNVICLSELDQGGHHIHLTPALKAAPSPTITASIYRSAELLKRRAFPRRRLLRRAARAYRKVGSSAHDHNLCLSS